MKLKKLWATLLVICILFSSQGVAAAVDEFGQVYDDPVIYWQDAIDEGDLSMINNYDVTDELSYSSTDNYVDKRISGESNSYTTYEVVDSYDQVSNAYYVFDQWISGQYYYTEYPVSGSYYTPEYPISGSYYDPDYPISDSYYTTDPTATPEPTPTEEIPVPTVSATPSPSPIPTEVTPEPTATSIPEPSTTAVPTVSATPTATTAPTVTATPTVTPINKPTTTPRPTPEIVTVPRNPEGIVYVVPEEKTPTKVTYNVDLEVGRYAKMVPTKKVNTTKKSSNTAIINDPRDAVGSFGGVYEARANKPGDATITFYNSQDNFTEEWNVHVFCRPLDFEKTEYVVEKPKGRDGYITVFLKYFEYEYEPAYNFEWSSSNTNVAYQAGGDLKSTFCRFCVRNTGATIITVKDMYGNSSQCVLLVKDPDSTPSEPEKTDPTPTPTPEITPDPGKESTGKEDPAKETTDISTLSAKKQKKLVKASGINLKLTSKSGKIKVKYSSSSDTALALDGYQIQVKSANSKKFKTKKLVTKGTTLSWNYTTGKAGKTFEFRVRGYKLINGKKVYTQWSKVKKTAFKK